MTTTELHETYRSALKASDDAYRDWHAIRGDVAPLEAGRPAPMSPPGLLAAEAKVKATWTAYEKARDAYYAS